MTVALLKNVDDAAGLVREHCADKLLDEVPIDGGELEECHLFVLRHADRPPRWVAFFEGYVSDIGQLGKVRTASALLLVRTEGHWYAFSFGQGRYLLPDDAIVRRFGLKIALNLIGATGLRSIDRERLEGVGIQAREQAAQDTGAGDFGLDVETDLLRGATGTPQQNATFGSRVSGADKLSARVDLDFEELPAFLGHCHERWLARDYIEHFPWVDQIEAVGDPAVHKQLFERLVTVLREGDLASCRLAPPKVLDWSRVSGFKYGRGRRNPEEFDLDLARFLETLPDGAGIDTDLLLRRYVWCVGENDLVVDRWSVLKCLSCELQHEGAVYVLSAGKWYQVAADFVVQVDDFVAAIPWYEGLPEYSDESEGDYNARVAGSDPDRIALMDRKNIAYGGGASKIEFCDLLTDDKSLIHVKRYSGSRDLSHLFTQGTVSGELLLTDTDFRARSKRSASS